MIRNCRLTFVLLLMCCAACSTDSCSCDGFEQRAFPVTKRDSTIPSAGQVRVTSHAIDYVESQVPYLLDQFLPNGLNFCIPRDTSGNPDICVDSTCSTGAPGCNVDLTLDDYAIDPVPTDSLRLSVVIGDVDERLNFDYYVDPPLLPGFTVNCYVQVFKRGASESTPAQIPGQGPIQLFVDQASETKDVGVRVGELSIDLSDVDFKIHGRGNVGDTVACEGASLVRNLFRDRIEREIRTMLNDTVQGFAADQLCRHCGPGLDACPGSASCSGGYCVYGNGQCAPRTLGIEGRLKAGSMLGEYTREPGASVDLMVKAADLARVDTGISIGMRAGVEPVSGSVCVPTARDPRPPFGAVPESPSINAETRPNSSDPFMLAIGVHRSVLEQVLYSTWASGAGCFQASDRNVMVLNTTAFMLVAPSLKTFAGQGKSALLAIVPQTYPRIELGANTIVDQGNSYEITDPLLRITWDDVDFHVFGYAQDRYTRLFTLRLDLDLPVALVPDGMGALIPVIPDIEDAIANVEPRRLEMLTETPEKLADLVPTLLGLAAPQLASSIPDAIDLPTFVGFRLDLRERDITSVDNAQFLAVFADLARETNPVTAVANTAIMEQRVDLSHRLDSGLVRPRVELDVRAYTGAFLSVTDREIEFSYRVDGGLWSLFERTNRLVIDDPLLVLQGEHTIEVRARFRGAPGSVDPTPAVTKVLVDFEAPEVRATASGTKVEVEAHDLAGDALEYRYRVVGPGEASTWSDWSSDDVIDLSGWSVGQAKVEVEARDRAGHVSSSSTVVRTKPTQASGPSGGGCDTGSAAMSWLSLLLFLPLLMRRRRAGYASHPSTRRGILFFAALGLLGLLLTGCNGGCRGELSTNSPHRCIGPGCNVEQTCQFDVDCKGICPGNAGGICEGGQCQCVRACEGGCAEGQFCCLSSGDCVDYGDVCSQLKCDPGYEPTVTDTRPNRESCELEDVDCACTPLPPLDIGLHGRYADIGSGGGVTAVSTYNETYGDLMVGVLTGGEDVQWYWVDGVPEDGEIIADPNGPRGGVKGNGDRVGTHTSIAVDANANLHVFYRDDKEDILKYARGTAGAEGYTFETTIFDDDGDTGYWPSAVVADGAVHVVWGVYEADDQGPVTQQRYATFAPSAAVANLGISPRVLVSTPLPADSGSAFARVASSLHDLSVAPDGLFLVFYDGIAERVGRARFRNGDWEEPRYLAVGTGPYASGMVDSQDREHVVFMQRSGLRYSRFGSEGPLSSLVHNGIRELEDEYFAGTIGEDVTLRLESDDDVVIVFQDAFDRSVYRARGNGEAAGWSLERLDQPQDVAGGFYLALDRDAEATAIEFVIDRSGEPEGHARVRRLAP